MHPTPARRPEGWRRKQVGNGGAIKDHATCELRVVCSSPCTVHGVLAVVPGCRVDSRTEWLSVLLLPKRKSRNSAPLGFSARRSTLLLR